MTIDVNNFKTWLENKDPDKFVGRRGNSCECPLATYLQETTGELYTINGAWYRPVSSNFVFAEELDLPRWAMWFVLGIDSGMGGDDSEYEKLLPHVTAKHALLTLEKVMVKI